MIDVSLDLYGGISIIALMPLCLADPAIQELPQVI